MGMHEADESAPGASADSREPEHILIAYTARSPVEHELIEHWARASHGDAARLVAATAQALGPELNDGDPLVVPVRVAWLPRERDGDRRLRWSDVLALSNPRRPPRRVQARIAASEPDRCRLIIGEPARVSDLHRRWLEASGGAGGPRAFAAWTARQATLACERAERAVVGDRYKVPRLVADQIIESAPFRAAVAALAGRMELAPEEVAARAADALRDMVAVVSPLALDFWALIMSPLHQRAWNVRVDHVGLQKLRELNRRHALVFLPSHRSYADPLVLGQILRENGFPPNHTLGGINMNIWPLGLLARRTGMIYIRRSFRDDEIYKLALREYFGYLAAKRFNLEWYIEGGRSRTGKLRPPRYGLLRFLADAVTAGRADDVRLVPVAIAYDQLAEVGSLAAEQRGAKKASEGLAWLARYVRAQQRWAGTVDVRFGEPISLAERLTVARDAGSTTTRTMQKLAFEICDGINRVTPIVPTSLVTLALLGIDERALTLREVRMVLAPLLDYVEARALPLSDGVRALRRGPMVRGVLDQLAAADVVTVYAKGTEPVYLVRPERHHVAAFYRNSAIHWFVNRAIVELATLHTAEQDTVDPFTDAWQEALRLRELLIHDFFFADKRTFSADLEVETELLDPGWRARTASPEQAAVMLESTGFLLAHRVLRPFLEAYLVVADRLSARDPRDPVDEQALLEECGGVGRQWLLQGRLHSPESVSTELFSAALRLAHHRDLVDAGREELADRRRAFLAEVQGTVNRATTIARLDWRALEAA
jgi:glycerol-3-phosphate O-acyltransferase